MATTTTAFGLLAGPPPNEDSMEMSSPAHRDFDDDIDIDFDDYSAAGPPQQSSTTAAVDDEYMFEDGERPGTANNDEVMSDDVQPQIPEQVMQDEVQPVSQQQPQQQQHEQDEDLLDYSEEEEQEQDVIVQQSTITQEPVQVEEPTEVNNIVDEGAIAAPPEAATAGVVAVEDVTEEHTHEIEDQLPPESDNVEELPPPSQEAAAEVSGPTEHDFTEEGQDLFDVKDEEGNAAAEETPNTTEQVNKTVEDLAAGDAQPDPASLAIDISTNNVLDNGPETPTDTGLNPMIVRYGDTYMPLFKSRNQPDGLLKDDNLASLSLAELIKSCRSRLALKTGEEISEDQELVLGFDSLGLHLVEDSRPAFESSLNEVIDVYLLLHYNEHVEEIPPLSLTISLQLKFTSMFTTLKRAADNGQGISSFAFLDSNEVAEEDWHGNSYEGDDGTHQDTVPEASGSGEHYETEEQYDDTTYVEDAENLNYDEGQQFHETQNGQDGTEQNAEEYYYQEQDATAYEGTQDEEDHQPQGDGHEEELQAGPEGEYDEASVEVNQAPEASVGALYNAAEGQTVSEGTAKAAHDDATASSAVPGPKASASPGSTTAPIDATNGQIESAGTYDKSADSHIESTDNDNADFSSLVQHPDVEQIDASTQYGTLSFADETTVESKQQVDAAFQPIAPGSQDPQDQHLAADELEDLDDPTAEAEYHGAEQDFLESAEAGEDQGNTHYDQADEYGEQQDEYNEDYQPGENDDQFDNGLKFLDEEHLETGEDVHEDTETQAGYDHNETTVAVPQVSAAQAQAEAEADDYVDFGDDIGFDDDVSENNKPTNGEARQTTTAATRTASSPLGKRSFGEHADADSDGDAPESKKARPS